jgi:hypothetical protein
MSCLKFDTALHRVAFRMITFATSTMNKIAQTTMIKDHCSPESFVNTFNDGFT